MPSEPEQPAPWYDSDPRVAAAVAAQRTNRESPARPPATMPKGVTYIIAADSSDLFKIGRTTGDPNIRLAAMQTGSPLPLSIVCTLPHASWETVLHHHFAAKRRQGEWFELTPEDLEAIRAWVN